MTDPLSLEPYFEDLENLQTHRWTGEVTEVAGLLIESASP